MKKIEIGNGYSDMFKAAVADFKRNKVRTFLTALGITIGVMSVVLLIALGLGLKNYIQEQFESLGSNLLFIRGGQSPGEGNISTSFGGFLGGIKFDEKDVSSLRKVSNVDYVVPLSYTSAIIKTESEEEYGNIMSSNEEAFIVLNLKSYAGEYFSKSDVNKGSKVIVLGYNIADELFGNPGDAVGQYVRISNSRFKIIAVSEKKGDPDMDSAVIMPYKSAFGTINKDKNFIFIYLGVGDKKNIESVKTEAETVLARRYDKEEFTIFEQDELLSTINTIFSVINSVLIAIGSISLLVGGIGIMNIMYATVTERTKEIGIRRAVGATQSDILKQFLTESVLLSFFGGLLGLILATVIVIGVRIFFPASINLTAVLIAVVVSSAIGIFFGVFPARRAAKLPPIVAIRYE